MLIFFSAHSNSEARDFFRQKFKLKRHETNETKKAKGTGSCNNSRSLKRNLDSVFVLQRAARVCSARVTSHACRESLERPAMVRATRGRSLIVVLLLAASFVVAFLKMERSCIHVWMRAQCEACMSGFEPQTALKTERRTQMQLNCLFAPFFFLLSLAFKVWKLMQKIQN